MARTRLIKPDFFLDDDLAKLPPLTRILFAGLWCLADREGRLEDRPSKIKAQVIPYDDHNIENALSQLHPEFITRYKVNGESYIQVNNFQRHQKPHKTERASIIPPAPLSNGYLTVKQPLSNVDILSPDTLTLIPSPDTVTEIPLATLPPPAASPPLPLARQIELKSYIATLTPEVDRFWEVWQDWTKNRIGKKWKTIESEKRAIKQLMNLCLKAGDARKIVDQSLANNWQGLFALKDIPQRTGYVPPDSPPLRRRDGGSGFVGNPFKNLEIKK
jgi:hypothetical protein